MRFTIDTKLFRKPVLKIGLFVYLALTIFEGYLSRGVFGSLLKYYGLALLLFWLLTTIKDGRHVRFGKTVTALILWLLVCLFSLIWAPGYYWGQYYALAIGNMVLIMLMVDNIDWDSNDLEWFLFFYKVSAMIFAVLMIQNADLYHDKGIRYTLNVGDKEIDPNELAGLLIPGLLASLHSLLSRRNRTLLRTMLDLVIIALVTIAILMGGSRGGMLGLTVGGGAYILAWVFKEKGGRVVIRFVLIGLLLFILSALVIPQVDDSLIRRVMPENLLVDQGSGRLEIWERAFQIWKKNPIFGIGLGGFISLTGKAVHNTYLLILTDTGIIGFTFWFAAVSFTFVQAWRNGDDFDISLLLSMLVIIFFLDAYQKKYMWNVFFLSLVSIKRFSLSFRGVMLSNYSV
ncbi:MAG: O-antigen ligase family protein [Bacillota bacterium]|nr:O-antigen ligase family protein [Bacillota bacterium]